MKYFMYTFYHVLLDLHYRMVSVAVIHCLSVLALESSLVISMKQLLNVQLVLGLLTLLILQNIYFPLTVHLIIVVHTYQGKI